MAVLTAVVLMTGLAGCSWFSNPVSTAISTPPDVDKGTDAPMPPEPTARPDAVIVFAELDGDQAHVSVSGYISGVVENGGVCTWVVANGTSEQRTDVEGLADRAQTSCGVTQLDAGLFTPGTWTVTLEYSSTAQPSLSSEPTTLEIP
ncbi:hypothetical protein [Plantibacter elymi (nom. nud.)]|nr:hypothetical protein [Plantibacter sp. VKM Ac-1784]